MMKKQNDKQEMNKPKEWNEQVKDEREHEILFLKKIFTFKIKGHRITLDTRGKFKCLLFYNDLLNTLFNYQLGGLLIA